MNQSIKVEKTVTINKSAEELYRFWHDFDGNCFFSNRDLWSFGDKNDTRTQKQKSCHSGCRWL